MSYITKSFYKDEFLGLMPVNELEIDRIIKRAESTIDAITSGRLKAAKREDFDNIEPFVRDNIKEAVCYLVEYYVSNGGYDQTVAANSINQASIGDFSYQVSTSEKGKKHDVPSIVIEKLSVAGVLYAGVGTAGGGVYYDC